MISFTKRNIKKKLVRHNIFKHSLRRGRLLQDIGLISVYIMLSFSIAYFFILHNFYHRLFLTFCRTSHKVFSGLYLATYECYLSGAYCIFPIFKNLYKYFPSNPVFGFYFMFKKCFNQFSFAPFSNKACPNLPSLWLLGKQLQVVSAIRNGWSEIIGTEF